MKSKTIFLLSFLINLITLNCYGQTATYNDVVNKKIKGQVDTYVTKHGEKFTVGDTITLGVAFRNEQFDYIQQNAVIEYYPLLNTASGSFVIIKKN